MPGPRYDDGGQGGGGSSASKTKTRAKQVNAREARGQAVLNEIVGAMQGVLGDYVRRQMMVPGVAASVGQALPPPPTGIPQGPFPPGAGAQVPGVGPATGGFFNGGPQPMGPGPWNGGFFNDAQLPGVGPGTGGFFNGGPQVIPPSPMGQGSPVDALLQLLLAMPQGVRR